MEFRVLGPLEVLDGGTALALGGPRQRLVLAYLILEANRVVSTDRLIDRIWGDEPPDAARAALFAYISRLRKLLGPARIKARPPGYVLAAERNDIDALRFADLVEEAHRGVDNRDLAAARLTEALQLWRGGALSDLVDSEALRPEIARLEAMRLGALEDRAEAEIDLGRLRKAIPQLEALTAEFPFRERLWSQLILALYRSGRQGDALSAYHRARTTLVEELGIDPSVELRHLHEQVLQQDPALDSPAPQPTQAQPAAAVGGATHAAGNGAPAVPKPPGRRRYLIVATALGLLAVGAYAWLGRPPATLPARVWTIGLDMPLSGAGAAAGQPVRNAVQMAVDDFNAAGGLDGSTLALSVLDDAGDPTRGVENAHAFVDDPATIAMIGGWGSKVTYALIPITNVAGLLECSPASTLPELTKPRDGALDLRAAHPDAISFVRLPPADDIQAVALASFAYRDLGVRYALVIDDTGVGRIIADPFEEQFKKLGGTTLRRAFNPGGDPSALLAPLNGADPPGLVFFGGLTDTGAAAVRRVMAESGHSSTPFLSWDPLLDGSGSQPGSYIQQVGLPGAIESYVAHASLPDYKSSFADAYRQRFGSEPDEYSAAGYACVQIITGSMRGIAASGPTADTVRQLLRAFAVGPGHLFESVLGAEGFDPNGDALRQFVTFYRVEASAGNGSGDWVTFKKQDFGPAP